MKKRVIGAFVMCMAIGVGVVTQAGITDGQRLYVSAKAIDDYQANIDSERLAVDHINEMIDEAGEKLSLYNEIYDENNMKSTADMEESLSEELQRLRMFNGLETVRGPGVEIQIDDGTRELFFGEDLNNILVHDMDILLVINELRRAGAEAISVNGQRITNSTAINCSGYTVRINGTTYARPFTIQAIGNGRRMSSTLLSEEGYGTSLKNWGVQFKLRLVDEMQIDSYLGEKTYKYMTKAEGDEVN